MSKYKLFVNDKENNLNKDLIENKILRIADGEFCDIWSIPNSVTLTTKNGDIFSEYKIKNDKYNTFIIYSNSDDMNVIFNEFSKYYSCIMIIDNDKYICGGTSDKEIKLLKLLPNILKEDDICVGMKVVSKIINK